METGIKQHYTISLGNKKLYIYDFQDLYYYLYKYTDNDISDIIKRLVNEKIEERDNIIDDLKCELRDCEAYIKEIDEKLAEKESLINSYSKEIKLLENKLNNEIGD